MRFIDLHQDMLHGIARLDGGFYDYSPSYLSGTAHASAIWSSMYPLLPESSIVSQLAAHKVLLGSHSSSLRLVSTAADLDSGDPRTGVLPHSEGFHLPDVSAETLESLWTDHTLRSLALTWNDETEYAYSCYGHRAAPLKPAGRKLVAALERSPMLLDLAHINDGGFYDVLDRYAPPVLVTHSFSRAVADHPRGLTDAQLRAVGEHGGLVGLAFDPDFLGRGSIDEALRHVDRIASLAGEDVVSVGSDWGVARMGELHDHATLADLLRAVESTYGAGLAEKFAFANAYEFLRDQLPLADRSCAA